MRAVELEKRHVVALLSQLRDSDAPAHLDAVHVVPDAVTDKDPRPPDRRRRGGEEPGRHGDQVREKVAVRQADRQRVGRPIRQAAERDASRIDRHAIEDVLQRRVDGEDVGAVRTVDAIPGVVPRIQRHDRDVELLHERGEYGVEVVGSSAAAVQQNEQRRSPVPGACRNEKGAVSPGQVPDPRPPKAERMRAGPDGARWRDRPCPNSRHLRRRTAPRDGHADDRDHDRERDRQPQGARAIGGHMLLVLLCRNVGRRATSARET